MIICTNATMDKELSTFFTSQLLNHNRGHLMYFKGALNECHVLHTLSEVTLAMVRECIVALSVALEIDGSLITDENVLSFMKAFQMITSYPAVGNFDEGIEWAVSQLDFFSEEVERKEYSRHFVKATMDWYDESEECVSDRHVWGNLFEFKRKKGCERLQSLGVFYKVASLAFDGNRILHIVPRTDIILSLVKVFQALREEVEKTIICGNTEQYYISSVIRAFSVPKYNYLIICSKPESTFKDLNINSATYRITETLKNEAYKKVVLIGMENELFKSIKERHKTSYRVVEENVKHSDFSEESREKLLEKVVVLLEATL